MKSLTRILCLTLVLAAALGVTGCATVVSVEPLATESNTVFDPALLGAWSDADGSESMLVYVDKGEQASYDILCIDIKEKTTYRVEGRLLKIGGQQFIDVTAHDKNGEVFGIPGHAFVHISKLENGLQLEFLDSPWLQERVQQSKSLPHSKLGGQLVLTGTSAQLQDFIQQFGLDEQAWSEPARLRKLQ